MGKFSSAPSAPPAPPPPPTREDPAIEESKRKLRQSEARRKGRAASILTNEATLGEANVEQPSARSAQVLG